MESIKKLIFVLALIIGASNLFAQPDNNKPDNSKTVNYKTGSLLWKISGNGLEKPSYVLGTFHVKPSNYFDQISGARASFDATEQVVGEIVMSDMMAEAAKMQQKMMMPADSTYKMLYNDSDYTIVDEELKVLFGAGLDQLGVLTPAGIQMSLLQIVIMKSYPSVISMDVLDSYVQKAAKEKQKSIVGLETIDHQIYVLFESMSLKGQADALLCTLKENKGKSLEEGMTADLKKMETMYENADLIGIYNTMKESPCSNPESENVLNKARNDAWMKKLPEIMKEKTSFIAVGALHLVGEEGLLNQLEKAGYTVEAVTNQ